MCLREYSITLLTPLNASSKEISRLTWMSSPGLGQLAWRERPPPKNWSITSPRSTSNPPFPPNPQKPPNQPPIPPNPQKPPPPFL